MGASNVSAYLITTSEGYVLLDTGFRETVSMIEESLGKLGFRLEDIRLILTNHAHYDHMGGVAEIKRRTKARLLANPAERPLFERGGKGDFAFGDKYPYRPVAPDAPLRDGTPVTPRAAPLGPPTSRMPDAATTW